MKRVSAHDVVGKLHVDSLAQQRELPLAGINSERNV